MNKCSSSLIACILKTVGSVFSLNNKYISKVPQDDTSEVAYIVY